MPFTKIVVVVDEDVDITQLPEVAWAVATRTLLNEKLIIKSDLPGLAIDPSCSDLKRIPETSRLVAQTAKIGIDATKPLNELKRLERIDIPLKTKRKILNMMG
jgi:UbiD family decarboxylase